MDNNAQNFSAREAQMNDRAEYFAACWAQMVILVEKSQQNV